MLPKRKLLKLELFFTKPDNIPASPIPVDIITAIAISEYRGNALLILSILKAEMTVKNTAPRTGLIPNTRPAATPARDVWENASPIIESLFRTTITPISGVIIAIRTPTIRAFIMKSYSKILSITILHACSYSCFHYADGRHGRIFQLIDRLRFSHSANVRKSRFRPGRRTCWREWSMQGC